MNEKTKVIITFTAIFIILMIASYVGGQGVR